MSDAVTLSVIAKLDAKLDRVAKDMADSFDALLQELRQPIERRPPDVPLHQRGFGVMDEPPA